MHPDNESCPDDADQEVIEEEIINESQQDVVRSGSKQLCRQHCSEVHLYHPPKEINCEDMDASSQYEEHVHHLEETLSSQTMEESIVRTSTLQGESKELPQS